MRWRRRWGCCRRDDSRVTGTRVLAYLMLLAVWLGLCEDSPPAAKFWRWRELID